MDKTLEQIKSYAEQGRYKRVPISKELYADAFTPISVMRTLRAASIAICWKVRRTDSSGEDIPSLDMHRRWRSPVPMGV